MIFMLWFCTATFSQPFGSTVGIKLCCGIGLGLRFRRNGLPVLINFWTKDRTKRTISKKKVGESLKSHYRSLCIMNVALQTCINNHPCRKVSWTRMFCLRESERERQMFMRDCLEQMTMFVHTTRTPFPDLWPSGCAACCATKFYAAVMAESDTLSEERRLMWPGPSKGSLITFLCIFRR